jgi:hypothetical protein
MQLVRRYHIEWINERQFHPPLSSCSIGSVKTRYHEKFLVLKEDFIIARINGKVDFKPAMERCRMSKCMLWNEGFCGHLDKRETGQ